MGSLSGIPWTASPDRIDRDQRMMFFYEIGVAASHRRRGIGGA